MTNEFLRPREVFLGGSRNVRRIGIGGNNPISIQTMWKEGITDICEDNQKLEKLLKDINTLKSLGCDILRFAVPDMKSAKSLVL
ncbi:MAG: flavodoxin-dependent (E)-4-hydroxy-3-methylbut-2-enyl-diphosphate synthase, partial [Treponema sp.]|nr:flavodoxin-dependent (E)-4-hydroxy-3-methylbut-2-enyl-diphosphate synthase [Treponema sp.]